MAAFYLGMTSIPSALLMLAILWMVDGQTRIDPAHAALAPADRESADGQRGVVVEVAAESLFLPVVHVCKKVDVEPVGLLLL